MSYKRHCKRGALYHLAALAAVLGVITSGCGMSADSGSAADETADADALGVTASLSEMFTDRDLEIGYDETTCTKIELQGDSSLADSDAVSISGSTVTITDEGVYLVTGSLTDGMILIDADDTDKIQLVLDGVTIHNEDGAAIYVRNADKVFITTTSNSSNALSNGGTYTAIDDNNIDAVIFAKSDLTLNGAGVLSIDAAAGHGIVSKDDLVLASGTYEITAASHALSGKDSVRIASGNYVLAAGKDAIHSENADDAELGFVYVASGSFEINADGDGISAEPWLTVDGGAFTITAGGGSANGETHTEEFSSGRGAMQFSTAETSEDTVSTKGLKAGTLVTINGGEFVIDSADDALHSNGDLAINGGTFEISTGDDGAHADAALTITSGTIHILQSYEGLEGLSIDVSGGEISIVSSDDGLNAAGGSDGSGTGMRDDPFEVTDGAIISISGGTLTVNAEGDGIDSNGDLIVTGGTVYISGPESSGNGALDYAGNASISGGVFVATGMSGMAQNFGSESTQGAIMATIDTQQAGTTIVLTDESGTELISWQSEKSYNSVVVSCPEIVEGQTYTLLAGTSSTEITMTEIVYGSTGMFGGGMGGGRGGMQGAAPNMENGEMPDRMDGGRFDGTAPEEGTDRVPQTPPDGQGGPGMDSPESGTAPSAGEVA